LSEQTKKRGRAGAVLLWVIAVLITLASAAYQRLTGPTHPKRGEFELGKTKYSYSLPRSHAGASGATISIPDPGDGCTAELEYKRFKTQDAPLAMPMQISEKNGRRIFIGGLPHQPPAGKLEYSVILTTPEGTFKIPESGPVVIRFRGDVPAWAMIPHILLMFLAMLFSTRTALELLNPSGRIRRLAWYTLVAITLGGMIFGPIVQYYSFGEWWTGAPLGWDLTDNKTLIAFIGWVSACWTLGKRGIPPSRAARWHTLVSAVLMFVIFMIPHSMLGSELDYAKVDAGANPAGAIGHGR
jgi:hypothetical protein